MCVSDPSLTLPPIRVGTFLPLTGPLAPRGQPVVAGLRAYIQRTNAEGGIHGRQIKLIALDDEFDPSRTIAVAGRLVEEEDVFCLVAPLGTPTNKAVLHYLAASGVPVVAPLSGSSLLTTPPKRNYFALQVNYVVEGTLLARYAVETLGARRIAVFHNNDDFGQEGARAFLAELAGHGIQPLRVELGWHEGLAAGVIVERLRAAEPEAVLLYTYLYQAAALLREAARQEFRPQWLGSYVLWDPVLFELAGPDAAEGLTVGQPYLDPLGPEPPAAAYRADLAQYAPGTPPGGYSASGYTAAALLVAGLRRAGPELTRNAFITALENLSNWSGGLVTGISYTPYDRRGAKRLALARATRNEWVTEKQMLALHDRLLNVTAPLAMQVNILTRQAMEELGKERIKQKATDVAHQCAIFLQHHPGISLAELKASETFRRIAMQPIGRTGYTALYGPAPFPAMRIHPNPDLIDVDLRTTDRPDRFPDWWRLYQFSLDNGGQEGGGFYFWADADGIVRRKYQYFLPVAGTHYLLGATTYLEEFFQPFEEAEQAIRRAVGDLTTEISRQILDPIQAIMTGVDRVSQGELNFEIQVGVAEEAQGLAQAFNQMTRNLRELSNRWVELNRELEGRVADRTQALAEANRQLQLSNRSLHEINRQLSEAKAVAEKARLEAEEANRLKSRFLSNISHELRAPLNAIINFSRLMFMGSQGPINDGQSDYLARIGDAGQHLLGLLNDMLDLSRIEAGVIELFREETDVADIIHGVMSTAVGLTRDKAIQLETKIDENLPPVWVDRTRFRQVLLNLLANAAKFTERGRITVTVERRGDALQVSVADTGPGISTADQSRIFDAYVTLSRDQSAGAGLGLNISRQLVEMHGGSIWVESRPGHGATFYLTLPLVDHSTPAGGQKAPAAGGPLVLVVDNDRATYRCLAGCLRDRGYRIAGLSDAGLALSKVSHLQPVALIFDAWNVGRADHLLGDLRHNWPQLPVLLAAFDAGEDQGIIATEIGDGDRTWSRTAFQQEVVTWLEA
jgi:signal transduction histidine kinase/ABC-type branched-subunit amino acid transport system substrate-binding protein